MGGIGRPFSTGDDDGDDGGIIGRSADAPRVTPPPLPFTVARSVPPPLPGAVAPLPVMEYRGAGALAGAARPTRLTVIGVISVCLGVLGLLGHLLSFAMVAQLFKMSTPAPVSPARMQSTMRGGRATAPPAPPLNVQPYRGELARAGEGLERAQREVVVAAVTKRVALPPDRKEMLRRLLAERGQHVIRGGSNARGAAEALSAPISEVQAAALITEAGQLPAGRDGLRKLGTHYFKTPHGVVLLDDGLARWHPTAPDTPAAEACRIEGNRFTTGGAAPRTTVAVVEAELDRLREELGTGFNPVQARVLADWLLRHAERAVTSTPYRVPAGWLPTHDARLLEGDTLAFSPGYQHRVWILANGATIDKPDMWLDPATGVPRTFPPPGITVGRRSAVTRPMAWTSLAQTLFGLAMSAYLLACGAMLLRDDPEGARHHKRWAWIDLISTLAAIAPGVWVTRAYTEATARVPNAAVIAELTWAVVAVALVLFTAYPVIVLLVLRHQMARNFYVTRGGPLTLIDESTRRRWAGALDRLSGPGATLAAAAAIVILTTAHVLTSSAGDAGRWWTLAGVRNGLYAAAALALIACAARIVLMRRAAMLETSGATPLLLLLPILLVTGGTEVRAQPRTGAAPSSAAPGRGGVTASAEAIADYDRIAALLPAAADAAHAPRRDPIYRVPAPTPEAKQLADELTRRTRGGDLILFHMINDEDIRVGVAAVRMLHAIRDLKYSPEARQLLAAAVPRLVEIQRTRGRGYPNRRRPSTDPAVRARELARAREIARAPRRRDIEHHLGHAVDQLVARAAELPPGEAARAPGGPFGDVAARRLAQAHEPLTPETAAALEAKAATLIADASAQIPYGADGASVTLLRKMRNSPVVWAEMRKAYARARGFQPWMVRLPLAMIAARDGEEAMTLDPAVRDDLMLIVAARGGMQTAAHVRDEAGAASADGWFDYAKLANDPPRVVRGLKSDEQAVRLGAAAVVKQFNLRNPEIMTAMANLPPADDKRAILEIARRGPAEFEEMTRAAVVDGDVQARQRLEAAGLAPTPIEWFSNPEWSGSAGAAGRPIDAELVVRLGRVMGGEAIREMLQSHDAAARQRTAERLRLEGPAAQLESSGATLRAMIDAAQAGKDPRAAARELAAAREARWGKPSPFATASGGGGTAGEVVRSATPFIAAASAWLLGATSVAVLLLAVARLVLRQGRHEGDAAPAPQHGDERGTA